MCLNKGTGYSPLFLVKYACVSESSSVGRTSASQVEGRGFEPRLSLHYEFIVSNLTQNAGGVKILLTYGHLSN